MKLLFIRTTDAISGAEIYNLYLLKALQRLKGTSVHFLTNYNSLMKKMKQGKVSSSIVYSPFPETGIKKELFVSVCWFYISLYIFLKSIKVIENGKRFDTIVLESMTEKLFLSPFLKFMGYRVIWIEHGPLFSTSRSSIVKKLYVYKTKWADGIIAVSEDTKKDLVHGGVPEEKVQTIYFGIEDEYLHLRKTTIADKKRKKQWRIAFLGSVTTEKGIVDLVIAAKKIIGKFPTTTFLIIGDGPQYTWAKSEVQRMGMSENIEFTGYVENTHTYLSTCDIFFFPTHHEEGLSLALLEAMAQGLIPVVRDIGGNRELVIDTKTGFLFKQSTDGERILEGIISGKISTQGMHKRIYDHIRTHFLMKHQMPKFLDIFHG